jgi:hypothetical protein
MPVKTMIPAPAQLLAPVTLMAACAAAALSMLAGAQDAAPVTRAIAVQPVALVTDLFPSGTEIRTIISTAKTEIKTDRAANKSVIATDVGLRHTTATEVAAVLKSVRSGDLDRADAKQQIKTLVSDTHSTIKTNRSTIKSGRADIRSTRQTARTSIRQTIKANHPK